VLEVESKAGQTDKVNRNIYGTNLLMRQADGLSLYYMYNGHADVTALIDATTGTTRATYYYDAFGNIDEQKYYTASGTETTPINNSIMYAGYQYDEETGLYYLNARMYDPKIARFLQEDTYSGTINDPLSLNLYAYCANNPLIYVDPTGHMYGYFDENGKWVGYTHSCNPAAYTVGGYNGADEYVYGSLYSTERTIIHKRTYEKVEAIDGNWATYFEEFNRDYGKPFVKDVLGIKEDSTLYKVIKKVAVNQEATLSTGLNFVTGTVQGTHLMYETLLTDAQFAYLEIGKSQGWFGLDNESVRKSAEEEIYGKVEYYANIWKSVPGAIGKDILTTLNPFNNTFTRGYFSDDSLREKVEYNQARINTVTTLYGLYRGVQRIKNWRASKNAPVNTAPVENTGSTGVGGNKPVPRTGPKGVDPDHHNLNVMVKNSEGNVKSHERFVSGNMTAEEKAMGYPKGQNASHTEARFSRFRGDTLDEGDIVIMTGQLPPCNSCKGYMNRLATEKNVDITYRWREGGVTKVWKAKKK